MTTATNNPPALDLADVNARIGSAAPEDAVRWAHETFSDGLVLTTSFGVQAAVMLHLVTRVAPDIPVVFIDTGFHFFDTYAFADELTDRLKLNLKVYRPAESAAWYVARHGKFWETDDPAVIAEHNQFLKVEPMERALDELGATATLAGVRREQTQSREAMPPVVLQRGRHKVHPILAWSSKDVHDYLTKHDLPYHPLRDKGYASIGDWYDTLPITAGQHEREGRFGGLKQECGLHIPASEEESASRDASML